MVLTKAIFNRIHDDNNDKHLSSAPGTCGWFWMRRCICYLSGSSQNRYYFNFIAEETETKLHRSHSQDLNLTTNPPQLYQLGVPSEAFGDKTPRP